MVNNNVPRIVGLNILYFISHGKGLGRSKMLYHGSLAPA